MIKCLLDAVLGLSALSPRMGVPTLPPLLSVHEVFIEFCFRSEGWRAAHLVTFCCEVWTEESHRLVAHLPGSPTSIQCSQQARTLPQHHRRETWLQGPAAVHRWVCGKVKVGEAPGLERHYVVLGLPFHQRRGWISSLACPPVPLPAGAIHVGLRNQLWSHMDLDPSSCSNICQPRGFGQIMCPLSLFPNM